MKTGLPWLGALLLGLTAAAGAGDAGATAVLAPADAGTPAAAPAPKPVLPGGSHCKMVKAGEGTVLSQHTSTGSMLDCQQEARAEVRARSCKESRERLTVVFSGDFNGVTVDPITMHIICPKKDAK
jgi:hypothetical protein